MKPLNNGLFGAFLPFFAFQDHTSSIPSISRSCDFCDFLGGLVSIALTKKFLDEMAFPKSGQAVHWDTKIARFGVKVSHLGTISFILDYTVRGKRSRTVIGRYGDITLNEARQRALEWQRSKEAGNLKPSTPKTAGLSFESMCDIYWERYGQRKKSGYSDACRIRKYLKPAFGDTPLVSLSRAQVATFHHELGKTRPYEANRNVELIGRIIELAKSWGFYPEEQPSPTKRIEAFPEIKRERFVTVEEMPRLVAAIDEEETPYVKALIWMYLLLGLRKNELLRLKWSDIDMKAKTITIAEPKGRHGTKSHVLPLPKAVSDLLKKVPKVVGNPYMFPGFYRGTHLTVIDRPWRRIRAKAGLEDVRIHDLRRTLGSWMAQSGVPINIIGKILNHSQLQTTQIYARLSTEPLREVMDEHAERVLRSVKKGQPLA
jgi:integrase